MAKYLDDDIVDFLRDDGKVWQHYWGDAVELLPAGNQPGKLRARIRGENGQLWDGFLRDSATFRSTPVLRLSMIDVQQGDGLILETPQGKTLLIDGGDNKLFARHAATRFAGSSAAKPKVIDAIIVTHGDADHFKGLSEIHASEADTRPGKALFIAPKRIYHNGLVKRPDKLPNKKQRPDRDMFGAHVKLGKLTYATQLEADPRAVPATDRNGPFNLWCAALDHWGARTQALTGQPMAVRRIDHLANDAFDFLAEEGISVDLHGPISETVNGAPALRFFRNPPKDAALMNGTASPEGKGSVSASHTINGHSISFRLRFGNVRLLFTGDLNHESMELLRRALPNASLACDILKAPHHGSADFEMAYLVEAAPVVSLISSGDESEIKEHIHPRATMMAALGKASRTTPAVIFNTELAAFFAYRGRVLKPKQGKEKERWFEGFERLNFGIIHIRTDGERVLAFTHSGKRGMNEAYRFTVGPTGAVQFAAKAISVSAPPKA
jgi:beta-lactamase superfamily II metal-dependent hydrolase